MHLAYLVQHFGNGANITRRQVLQMTEKGPLFIWHQEWDLLMVHGSCRNMVAQFILMTKLVVLHL